MSKSTKNTTATKKVAAKRAEKSAADASGQETPDGAATARAASPAIKKQRDAQANGKLTINNFTLDYHAIDYAVAPKVPLSCMTEHSLDPEQLRALYRLLQLTRLVEERLVNLYRQTKVVGGVFRSLGQEATAVGTCYALEERDFISPLIRDLGAVLAKGIRPREIFAQYMAKAWGPSEGRDLNIHFGDMKRGFVGPISHLGDMIPVMTGIALGARMQKKDIVCVAYIGDGGMSTGAFHEGLNFAAVQKLPLIVVAEYNHYAYSTPTALQTACKDLADKAASYAIPGHIVDGNDILACYETTKKAVEYARGGGGAVLIEAKTYRRKGHAEHDDQRYIAAGELEWWAEHNDPVTRYERYLLDNEIMSADDLEIAKKDALREIDEDVEWAESSPMPDPERAAYNVFDNEIVPPTFKRKALAN